MLPAITRIDIFDTADRLLAATGRHPTNQAVRDALKRGSMTTISEHMRDWRKINCDESGGRPLPKKQLEVITAQVYTQLEEMANERVREVEEEAKVLSLEQQDTITSLNKKTAFLDEQLTAERKRTDALAKELSALREGNNSLEERNASLAKQLDTAKAKLSDLAAHSEAAESRHKRESDALRAEIHAANKALQELQRQYGELQSTAQHHQKALYRAEADQRSLQDELDKAKAAAAAAGERIRNIEESEAALRQRNQQLNELLASANETVTKESASREHLEQRLADMAERMRSIDDDNAALRQDKKDLASDKAALRAEISELKTRLKKLGKGDKDK